MEDRSNQIQQIEEQNNQSGANQEMNLLNDRFQFKKQINEGCFGKVYDVVDTHLPERRLIAKMQTSDYQFKREKEFLELFTSKFNEEHKEELEKAQAKGQTFLDKLKLKLMMKSDFPMLVSSGEQSMTEWIFVGRYDQFEECQQRAISFDSEFIVKYPKNAKEKQNNDSKNKEVKNKSKGKVYQKVSKLNYCLIMDKFGDSLREIVDLFSNKFTVQTVLQIALQLVTILESIHNLGYVYNDLKPDNILVGDMSLIAKLYGKEKSPCKPKEMNLHKLRLIDFGLVTNYLDENGNHIEDGKEDKFKGSMLFASKYAFNFVCTSRRDDLISLIYNLVFFLDLDRLTFINQVQSKSKQNKFKIIKEAKMAMTPKDLCGNCKEDSPAHCLLEFTEEVFSYEFDTKPDYERLRSILIKSMHNLGFSPSKNYDWTIKENHNDNEEYISNESGNSELFGNLCLDAERASMQALQASIRPNRLLKNQQVIVGTIREEEKSDKNEPLPQHQNMPNQQPQQVLNAANAQGQIPAQNREDSNMPNNANGSESVSIDSMRLREMNHNSHVSDYNAFDQQKQQQVNPQIQGIIKNDDPAMNCSVKMQNQNQNSTVGQNQHRKAYQQSSQQPLSNGGPTSINNMMNQYLFQTKSNHRFLHDNKGVFLKEMSQNAMIGPANGITNQPFQINSNQLQQNNFQQQQQYQSAGGFVHQQDPNQQMMGQQVQPQLLLQQFNSNCILQQPFNHHQVNNNSYQASIVNQQQRQQQQQQQMLQQQQPVAHLPQQAIVQQQPQYAQNSIVPNAMPSNANQKNMIQVDPNGMQRGQQLMQHQQLPGNTSQANFGQFQPQMQLPQNQGFPQQSQQQLQQIVGQGNGMPVGSARVQSAVPHQQMQQPVSDNRQMYQSVQQSQQQFYYYLQQPQMQNQLQQQPMQQNFMQNPQIQPQIHQQMHVPQQQMQQSHQQQLPSMLMQSANAGQPLQQQAYYMPMAQQMSNRPVNNQNVDQSNQNQGNAFIGSHNPLSVQNSRMSQM